MGYGVDPTGRPVAETNLSTGGQDTGCPPGQRKDQNGNCNSVNSTQTSQTSLTGNADGPQYASSDQVRGAYQKYLHRDFNSPDEGTLWQSRPDWENGIKNSAEAQKVARTTPTTQPAPSGGGANAQSIISQWQKTHPASEGLEGLTAELNRNGITASPFMYGSTPSGNEITLNGSKYKVKTGNNDAWWDPSMGEGDPHPTMQSFLGGGYSGPTAPTTPPPDAYTPNKFTGPSLPTYTAQQFTKPDPFTNAVQAPTQELIQRLLASEGSLSPDIVAKMKEGQKSTELSMADQLKQQYTSDAASRGVSGGGALGARIGGIDAASLGDISKGYRDTDIAAATTNRADQLNALGAAGTFSNNLLSQYLGTNAQRLATEQAQAGEQGKQFQSEQAKSADDFQRYLATEQLGLTANDQAFAHWAASQGITLNWQNAAMLADQFNKTYGLNVGRFLAGQ